MDRPTPEEGLGGFARALVIVAGLACAALSLSYLLAAVVPLFYFHGYVRGYYSLLEHRLYYAHDGRPVPMPHTDYVRHVSVTFLLLSVALLALSLLALALASRRSLRAPGLAYGSATGLVVLYGLLNGYLRRAVELDLGRFGYLMNKPNNEVVYRTLAGTITFEGVGLERTFVNGVVLASPLPLVLLALAVVASAGAAGLTLYAVHGHAPAEGLGLRVLRLRKALACSILFLVSFSLLASVFAYYPVSLTVVPQPPPLTFEPPAYNYTCTAVARTARGALTYTDFEAYPVPGWTSSGGTWSSVSGVAGAKGNVLRGVDDDRGLGGASHYYYSTSLSTYTSLWAETKTRWASGSVYHGISMMNSGRNRMFTAEIYTTADTTGFLQIWSYNVVTTGWQNHANVTIPNYHRPNWYTMVVFYSVSGTTISITAALYDASGSYVTSASATITHANVFRPAYVGVTVDNGSAYFDEFIVSTVDPRSLLFSGFRAGMRVEVWDNLGYLVNSTTAPASSFHLNVTADVVAGTGVDGRIVVRYPDAYLCGVLAVPTTDAILGGDSYGLSTYGVSVSLGANKTSANVTAYVSSSGLFNTTSRLLRLNASQTLHARLVLENVTAPPTLNLDVWLEGAARSTNITIRDGARVSNSTSVVQLNVGLNNSLVVSGHFTATGQNATLRLTLEYCTAPGGLGACVRYPLVLTLVSGSSTSLTLGEPGLSTDSYPGPFAPGGGPPPNAPTSPLGEGALADGGAEPVGREDGQGGVPEGDGDSKEGGEGAERGVASEEARPEPPS